VIKDNYEDTLEKAKTGNIDAINPQHQIKYYGTIKKIEAEHKKMPENLLWEEGGQPNLWIHGPTRMFIKLNSRGTNRSSFTYSLLGTGKSHTARSLFNNQFYPKIAANKWWDKYHGEDNVLIEDMDTSHAYQGYNLKIWADKYAFPVEVKNGADWIRPKQIIVTSNYSIKEIFPDPSIHLPLLERFKEIHRTIRYDPKANALNTLKKKPKTHTTKPLKKRARKYDKPKTKPAMFRQNASGMIVENNIIQPTMEEAVLPLNATQEIEKEKEVIELIDSDVDVYSGEDEINYADDDGDNSYQYNYETCSLCNESIITCTCMESYDSDDENIGYKRSDESDASEDLFNM